MKKIYFVLVALLFIINLSAQSDNIKVMTYNIRCGFCENVNDINHWSKRKFLLAHLIKMQNPDLIGLQEAEQFQIKDLIDMLGDYSFYGVGRDDGRKKGESAVILYKKNRFILKSEKTLWLSETPKKVSKGWDAALNRTVTITRLIDKHTTKSFYFLNTHFDHMGEKARTESSKLILNECKNVSGLFPIILVGDFNYTSTSEGYRIITENLFDAGVISETPAAGGNISFNGFGNDIQPNNKIDFIFVSDKIQVLSHLIDTTLYNGLYPSDHYPVISEIKFK